MSSSAFLLVGAIIAASSAVTVEDFGQLKAKFEAADEIFINSSLIAYPCGAVLQRSAGALTIRGPTTISAVSAGNSSCTLGISFNNASVSLVSLHFLGIVKVDLANARFASFQSVVFEQGAGLRAKSSNVSLSHCTFSNRAAFSSSIVLQNSTASLSNIRFHNCSSTGRGGALHVEGIGSTLVQDSSFSHCSASRGGGIYAAELGGASLLSVSNSSFLKASAITGAGIFLSSLSDTARIVVEGSLFADLLGIEGGGGINGEMVSDNVAISVVDCVFNRTNALQLGGGLFMTRFSGNAIVSILGTLFTDIGNETVPAFGGAISTTIFDGFAKLFVSGCVIRRCEANSAGAGIHAATFSDSTSGLVESTSFSDLGQESQTGLGTAVFLRDYSDSSMFTVANCSIRRCDCYSIGGGIAIMQSRHYSYFNVSNVRFSNIGQGMAPNYGGGIALMDFDGEAYAAIEWCSFQYLNAYVMGGGVHASDFEGDALFQLSDCSFSHLGHHIRPAHGGAISLSGILTEDFPCVISGSTFQDTGASVSAGAIFASDTNIVAQNLHFKGTFVTESTVGGGGGGINIINGAFHAWDLVFADTWSESFGGSVLLIGMTESTLTRCSWLNSTAKGSGGGIYVAGSTLLVENGNFTSCGSLKAGGAISGSNAQVTLMNSSFFDTVSEEGGAVFISEAQKGLLIAHSTFRNSHAVTGGTFHFSSSPNVCVLHCSLVNTSSAGVGGAVLATGSSGTFLDVSITNSHSYGDGGCLWSFGSDLTFNDTLFECRSDKFGGGGRLEAFSSISLNNCTMHGAAMRGGCFLAMDGALQATNSRFLSSFSTSQEGDSAGCIHALFPTFVTLTDCEFSNCSSDTSAGVMQLSEGEISGCKFVENQALLSAGGVRVAQGGNVTLTSCLFKGNTAGTQGGAISVDAGGNLLFSGGKTGFFSNAASVGGAVYFKESPGATDLAKTVHQGNVAYFQGGFAASGPVSVVLDPPSLATSSRRSLSLSIDVLDAFGNAVHDCNHTKVTATPGEQTHQTLAAGVSGYAERGRARLPDFVLSGPPGARGTILFEVGLVSASLNFSLWNCSAGEILRPDECRTCPFGSFSLTVDDKSCSDCPLGAVCYSNWIAPKTGYWKLVPGDARGVCRADECFLPACAAGVCLGAVSMQLSSSAELLAAPGVWQSPVLSGCRGVNASSGSAVLVADGVPGSLIDLRCFANDTGLVALLLNGTWPSTADTTVQARFFLLNSCHRGCSEGYGRTSKAECGRCQGAVITFLLAGAFLLVGVTLVAVMTWSTLRNAEKKESQLVSIAKVVWTYAQMVALCAALPMNWPSGIEGLFRVQDAASSANSRQFLSLDCFLHEIGMSNGSSIVLHTVIVLLVPLLMMSLAAAVWLFLPNRSADKYFVSCLTILFLCYPSLCRNAFELFPCEELSTDEFFMTFSLATSCSSASYSLAVWIGAIGVLLYAFGIPATSFFLVWRKRRLLSTSYARKTVGFLYLGYSSKCYFYESVVLLKKMLFGGLVLMSSWIGAQVSAALSILLFVGAYFLHVELKPFEDAAVDRLERLSLAGLIATTICGSLFLSQELSFAAHLGVECALFGANAIFFGSAIYLAVPYLSRRRSREGVMELRRVEMLNPVAQHK